MASHKSNTAVQQGKRSALEARLLKAFERLPRDTRAWMKVWYDLVADLGDRHPDTAEALQALIEKDADLEGYIPAHPDRDFLAATRDMLKS